jgi:hypothetical protein
MTPYGRLLAVAAVVIGTAIGAAYERGVPAIGGRGWPWAASSHGERPDDAPPFDNVVARRVDIVDAQRRNIARFGANEAGGCGLRLFDSGVNVPGGVESEIAAATEPDGRTWVLARRGHMGLNCEVGRNSATLYIESSTATTRAGLRSSDGEVQAVLVESGGDILWTWTR